MLSLYEHLINGAVAEYIVRRSDGSAAGTFSGSPAGRAAARAMMAASEAIEYAEARAAEGWSQPDIRVQLQTHYSLSWARADMVATDAVTADNAKQAAAQAARGA